MKLSARTVAVLKNFATVNPSILVKPGSRLATLAPSKKILAKAEVDETFDREFGIYDLPRLINGLSLFKDPEITLGESSLVVSGEGRSLRYTYSNPSAIVAPPDKEVKLPSIDAEFHLPAGAIQGLLKAGGILGSPDIRISSDGSRIVASVLDVKNPTSNAYDVELEGRAEEFSVTFKTDTFKFITNDYDVTVSRQKIAEFRADGISYILAAEAAQ
jgi:hypothetical protein